jgi:hypothetical protein
MGNLADEFRARRGSHLTSDPHPEKEMTATDIFPTTRELDRRSSDGIDVRLLWSPRTNHVSIAVTDEDTGSALTFVVDGAEALTAFNHPYAYAIHALG